jgi:hypothetical protein
MDVDDFSLTDKAVGESVLPLIPRLTDYKLTGSYAPMNLPLDCPAKGQP